jgi:hypothetical protein
MESPIQPGGTEETERGEVLLFEVAIQDGGRFIIRDGGSFCHYYDADRAGSMHVLTFSLAMIGHKRSPAKLRWREIRTERRADRMANSLERAVVWKSFVWPSECLSRWG